MRYYAVFDTNVLISSFLTKRTDTATAQVVDAIEMADDNYTYFLDLETGDSVFLADELITGLDNEGLEDEIEENPERYLRLPTKFEIHEYHIMEEFIWTLKGERADKLDCAIRGRGAFRRFKDLVDRMGISQQ